MNSLGEYGHQKKILGEWTTGPFWDQTQDEAIKFVNARIDYDKKYEKRAEIIKIIEVGK